MNSIFLKLLNTSVSAGWLILVVLVVRFLIRKSPKSLQCLLWLLVGLRLVCPFPLKSELSLVPGASVIPKEILEVRDDAGLYEVPSLVLADNPALPAKVEVTAGQSIEFLQIDLSILGVIWLFGALTMMGYATYSWWKLRQQISASVPLLGNLYICDDIDSPFILGILNPVIYMPSGMSEETCNCVIAHERAHLQRRDHWWKPLAFIFLAVYWFNPLIWVAYILLCRDIEAACDEKVIRSMEKESVTAYMEALLVCATHRRSIMVCPVAFGEVSTKERVRNILNYRKPTVIAIVAAVMLIILAGIFFFPEPYSDKIPEEALTAANQAVVDRYDNAYVQEGKLFADLQIMMARMEGEEIRLYAWVLTERYDENLQELGGGHNPAVIMLRKEGEEYVPVDFQVPKDGANYASSIRENFPITLWLAAMDSQRWIKQQEKNCYLQAKAYFERKTDEGESAGGEQQDYGSLGEPQDSDSLGKQQDFAGENDQVIGQAGQPESGDSHVISDGQSFQLNLPEPSQVTVITDAAEIHDLTKAILSGSYGNYVIEDADTLQWLARNFSKGKAEAATKCPFSTKLYLYRKDGTIIEIQPAEDSCDIFKSEDAYFQVGHEVIMQMLQKFGVKISYSTSKTTYDGDIRILSITDYWYYQPQGYTIARFNKQGQLLTRRADPYLVTYTYDDNGYCIRMERELLGASPAEVDIFDYRYDLKGKGLTKTVRRMNGQDEEVFDYSRSMNDNQILITAVDYINALPISIRQDIRHPEDPFIAIVSPPDRGDLIMADEYEVSKYTAVYEANMLLYDLGGGRQFVLYLDYTGKAIGYKMN